MLWNSCTDSTKPLRVVSLAMALIMLGLFTKISLFNQGGLMDKLTSIISKKHVEETIPDKLHEATTTTTSKKDETKKGQ
jgi:hypothetical protein